MNNSNKLIQAYGKHGNIKQSNKSSISLKSPFKVVELSLGTDAYFKGLMCNIANSYIQPLPPPVAPEKHQMREVSE